MTREQGSSYFLDRSVLDTARTDHVRRCSVQWWYCRRDVSMEKVGVGLETGAGAGAVLCCTCSRRMQERVVLQVSRLFSLRHWFRTCGWMG